MDKVSPGTTAISLRTYKELFHVQRCCTSCGAKLSPWSDKCFGCRIKANVEVLPSGCWLWNGAKRKGLGIIRVQIRNGSTTYSVHRIAYAVWIGDAPAGATLEQTCGNRDCVNPNHQSIKPGLTLWGALDF